MPPPSKSDMLTILQANGVDVPSTATISQTRSLYQQWVDGPYLEETTPEEHNESINQLAKSLPVITDDTDEKTDEQDKNKAAATDVPLSLIHI